MINLCHHTQTGPMGNFDKLQNSCMKRRNMFVCSKSAEIYGSYTLMVSTFTILRISWSIARVDPSFSIKVGRNMLQTA